MIPEQVLDLSESDFEIEENETSYTYKMYLNTYRIVNKTDDLEAVIQAIHKILNTERFEYPIYSWDYGVEFADLYGEDPAWVCPELKRRITEALTQDERIESVDGFDFTINRNKIHVSFTVISTYGNIEAEREVDI